MPFAREPDDGGESTLCKKKDEIISKFDELLKKLNGEELSANITMGKVTKEYKEAMTVCVCQGPRMLMRGSVPVQPAVVARLPLPAACAPS